MDEAPDVASVAPQEAEYGRSNTYDAEEFNIYMIHCPLAFEDCW